MTTNTKKGKILLVGITTIIGVAFSCGSYSRPGATWQGQDNILNQHILHLRMKFDFCFLRDNCLCMAAITKELRTHLKGKDLDTILWLENKYAVHDIIKFHEPTLPCLESEGGI